MRRLQHVLGMLIAMFALCSFMMLSTGCGGGENGTDDMTEEAGDAADEAGDAMDAAGDAMEDAADDVGGN